MCRLGNLRPIGREEKLKHSRRPADKLLLGIPIRAEAGLEPSQRLFVIPLPILANCEGDAIVRRNAAAEQVISPGFDDKREAVFVRNRIAVQPHGVEVTKQFFLVSVCLGGIGHQQRKQGRHQEQRHGAWHWSVRPCGKPYPRRRKGGSLHGIVGKDK